MISLLAKLALCIIVLPGTSLLFSQDWPRFRGPNGSGLSPSTKDIPTNWKDVNIKWKLKLPGPGHSSPIVVDDKLFLTYWSGYGVDENATQKDLRLHLLCIDKTTGQKRWDQSIEPALPEEPYQAMFKEHGYASHTPVSDGKHVWAYFGKSGAVCFDLEGNLIWQKRLGNELDPDHWGSSSSPIVYKDILIVTASVECNTIFGLNKHTGETIWEHQSDELTSTWSTPIIVKVNDKRSDVVIPIPYKLWGLNPENGELVWQCNSLNVNAACSSAIVDRNQLYFVERGRRGGGSVAIRIGGRGDVSKTHVVWKSRQRGHIGTPIIHDDNLYWISSGIANCVNIRDGSEVYRARLKRPTQKEKNNRYSSFPETGTPGGHHSSPVVHNGIAYYVSRGGDVYVFRLGEKFEQLAVNRIADGGDFSASPAISDGNLYIRSTKTLYCVSGSESKQDSP